MHPLIENNREAIAELCRLHGVRSLRSLDRRAMHVSDLTDEDLAALDYVEIPSEAARYNHEMT
jgi:hypothetical protein